MAQGRPGWPVRPLTAVTSQSAWGNPTSAAQPSTAATAGSTQQSMNLSPGTHKHSVAVRMPSSQPSPTPKQPVDVSRQLFPEGRTSTSPAMSAVSASEGLRAQEPSQVITQPPYRALSANVSRSPPSEQPAQLLSSSNSNIISSYMVPSVSNRAPAPSLVTINTQKAQASPAVYSPFDVQLGEQQAQQQPLLLVGHHIPSTYRPTSGAAHRPAEEDRKGIVHPSKAPGFRSSVSPQISLYPSMPQQNSAPMLADENGFSRAPGARGAGLGVGLTMHNNEHTMSAFAPSGMNSNVHHAMLAGPGGQAMMAASAAPHMNRSAFMDTERLSQSPNHFMSREMINAQLDLASEYTKRDQPMTLPRISSSLNPNASEFTAHTARFGHGGDNTGSAQHSPTMNGSQLQRSSPTIQFRPATAGVIAAPGIYQNAQSRGNTSGHQQHGLDQRSLDPSVSKRVYFAITLNEF